MSASHRATAGETGQAGAAAPARGRLEAEILERIDGIDAATWNRLAGDANPFVRHEFLAALERNGCVGEGEGWLPHHVCLRAGGEVIAVMPLYLKAHSFGEFVFDWGWADAYERAGREYYPKLLGAVPFTPATGPRLLHDPARTPDAPRMLAEVALEIARRARLSSVHWLFLPPEQAAALEAAGMQIRLGTQFHWHNPGYRDFADYLDRMTSKKRKQIRRERREAGAAPVEVEVLAGREVSGAQWAAYHALYASTYDRKWGYPSLTPGFFEEIGETMGDSVVLVLARRGRRYVAGAHLLRGPDALFGRNWGCSEHHPSLHFEMCYYRPIELCIEAGLTRFEAGAQGEHKLSRGFLPVLTRSAHWLADPRFARAVAEFLAAERDQVARYAEAMARHSPFKAT